MLHPLRVVLGSLAGLGVRCSQGGTAGGWPHDKRTRGCHGGHAGRPRQRSAIQRHGQSIHLVRARGVWGVGCTVPGSRHRRCIDHRWRRRLAHGGGGAGMPPLAATYHSALHQDATVNNSWRGGWARGRAGAWGSSSSRARPGTASATTPSPIHGPGPRPGGVTLCKTHPEV